MLRLSPDLLEHLAAGGRLLVPSRQRAAAVRLAYAWAKQAEGREVWRTPAVESIGGWLSRQLLERSAQGLAPLPRVLDRVEEWILWRGAAQTLLASADNESFGLSADSLADRLQLAAATLGNYSLRLAAISDDDSVESRWLAQAVTEVESAAASHGAIAQHQLFHALRSTGVAKSAQPAYQLGVTTVGREQRDFLVSVGFDECAALPAIARTHVVSSVDPATELRAAAAWCRAHLQRDPRARLLVIVQDLALKRPEVERIFAEELAPRGPRPFGFEGGQPLADYPEPAEALRLLAMLVRPSSERELAELLELECWGKSNRLARARAATVLRARFEARTSPGDLPAHLRLLAEELSDSDGESLRQCASRVVEALQHWQQPQGRVSLVERFTASLTALGWAKVDAIDSSRQQIRARWQELLEIFAQVTARIPSASRAADLVVLWTALVRRDWFAPAGEDLAITVTASLDHPIVHYDGIWVTSLQADRWPRPKQLDPLIPWALQRAAKLPGASAELRLQEAEDCLTAWQGCASELVLSCARVCADEKWLPSMLLEGFETREPPPLPSLAARLRQSSVRTLEALIDERGPPFDARELVPGGVSALEDQFACPFRAYVTRRLCGREFDDAEPGVAATERGELLHAALKELWTRIGSRRALLALGSTEAQQLIAAVVSQVTARRLREAEGAPVRRRVLQREMRRLGTLLKQLLESESTRGDFAVLATEHELRGELAGARLGARIDRIDRLIDAAEPEPAAAALVIIDYKSGRYASKSFQGERFNTLQLWTYALLLESPTLECGQLPVPFRIEGLGNLHLTQASVRYAALSTRENWVPKVISPESWQQARQEAATTIHSVIAEFLSGDARVAPRQQACRYCELTAVCRRTELGLLESDEAAEESVDE